MMRIVSLLSLLWSLVEVHCHSAPYISFLGNDVPNHGYVDLGVVGEVSDSVQCHSDLATCCSGDQGIHRGDWYFPNGTTRLGFSAANIYQSRGAQRVDIRRRNNANSPVGIYRCDIATLAVHDVSDNLVRDTVYVGLYTASGGMGKELVEKLADFHAGFILFCFTLFRRCHYIWGPDI